jgi:hypothetical protein
VRTSRAKKVDCRHAQRLEDEGPDRRLEGGAGDGLNHPAGEAEAGVAVGPGGAQGGDLREVGHPGHVPLEGVVALAGVLEAVALPAAGVAQEVAHRDPRGGVLVGEPEVGEVGADGGVEVEPAGLDEAHGGGGEDGLGDGAGQEEGVGGDGQGVLDAGDAEAGEVLAAVVDQAEGGAGDAVAVQGLAGGADDAGEVRVGGGSSGRGGHG